MNDSLQLTRPASLDFNHHTGAVLTLPPVTRGQMRRVFELDKTPTATPEEQLARRARMFDILLESATAKDAKGAALQVRHFLDSLTPLEEVQIINAVIAQHHGLDPRNAADMQAALYELAVKKKALNASENSSPITTPTP